MEGGGGGVGEGGRVLCFSMLQTLSLRVTSKEIIKYVFFWWKFYLLDILKVVLTLVGVPYQIQAVPPG